MDFIQSKPIYVQIADRLMDDIVAGKYVAESRIPSVRECAINYSVNPNTAMKAIEELSRANVIYNKRGQGYFVSLQAKEEITKRRKQEFLTRIVPELRKQMQVINMTIPELIEELEK